MNIDWTSVVLALITLVSGCGWIIDRRKLRQEVAALRNAIQKIDACAHRDNCPVISELQRKPEGNL